MVVKRASCFGPDFCFIHKYPESIFRSNTVLTYDQPNMAEGFRYNRPDKKTTSLNRGSQLFLDHSVTVNSERERERERERDRKRKWSGNVRM